MDEVQDCRQDPYPEMIATGSSICELARLRKIYEVVPDEDAASLNQLRVIDESGQDYLYPASCFADVELSAATQAAVFQAA